LASDGQGSSHALEDVIHVLVHPLNRLLVVSFSFIDRSDDALSVGSSERDVCEVLLESELDVTCLEVVVVDLDFAGEGVGLGVYEPRGLPLTAPESGEVRVDAADVDLQVTVLVEAEAGTSGVGAIVQLDVCIDGSFDARPI
jgi:hypothetical protein